MKLPKLADQWPLIDKDFDYLKANSTFKDFQVAALIGQEVQESLGSPTIEGDKGTAYGLFQWRGDRLKGLEAWATAHLQYKANREIQLSWALQELHTTYEAVGDRLAASTDLATACEAAIGLLRPKGYTLKNPRGGDGFNRRMSFAVQALERYHARQEGGPAMVTATPPAQAAVSIQPALAATLSPPDKKPPPAPQAPGALAKTIQRYGNLELGAGATASQAAAVRQLQMELKDYGYPLQGTGYFGPATRAAVLDFQRLENLEADGIVGPQTATRLDFYHGRQLPAAPALQTRVERPLWLTNGLGELGVQEVPGKGSNPTIMRWAKAEGGAIAKAFTDDDIAWCSLYANHLLTAVGLPGTETLWALDWDGPAWPNVKLAGYAIGCFMPMKRDGGGHIAVLVGRDQHGNLMGLGGNQGNTVSVAPIPLARPLSFRWPKSVPLPAILAFSQLPVIASDGRVLDNAG